jgi:hypothetical protein
MIIPVYSAAPPALYFAWRERSQSIFLTEEICQKFDRVKKAFIIIGNKDAGADGAVTIINVPQVQIQLKRFLNMFITG